MEDIQPVPARHFLDRQISTRQILFIIAAIISASTLISAPIALLLGLVIAQTIGNPFRQLNHRVTQLLLQASVVALGFGMNAHAALKAGKEGFLFTLFSITLTLVAGVVLGRLLKVEKGTAWLITSGTAICGGSAIAAIAPAISAKEDQTSVALGTVFILNAVALFIFPVIGSALSLTQEQFGVWSAVAIHDTSSVVGAGSKFGAVALETATTIKLGRALWIIPLSLISSFLFKQPGYSFKIPWFILFFILAMLANTFIPALQPVTGYITVIAKAVLTLTLFLIGTGLSRATLRNTGIRPMLQGILTWILIAGTTLLLIIRMA